MSSESSASDINRACPSDQSCCSGDRKSDEVQVSSTAAASHKGGLSWSIDPPEHVELTKEEIEERRMAKKAAESTKTTRYAPMTTKPRGAC
jgi:hypothetical protein